MTNHQLLKINEDISNLKKQDTVFLSVPGEMVCSIEVTLPPLHSKNKEQVIGYAIEDKIASNMNDIKIFHSLNKKTGTSSILWCERNDWDRWQEKLNSLDNTVEKLLPDYLYLPLEDNSWTIKTKGGYSLLRSGESTGMRIENSSFIDVLSLQLENATTKPSTIIYDGNVLFDSIYSLCQNNQVSFIQKKLALFEVPSEKIPSLLPKKRWALKKCIGPWRLATALGLIWLTLLTGGLVWKHSISADYLLHHKKSDPALKKLKTITHLLNQDTTLKIESFQASPRALTLTLSGDSTKNINDFIQKLAALSISHKESDWDYKPDQTRVKITIGESS